MFGYVLYIFQVMSCCTQNLSEARDLELLLKVVPAAEAAAVEDMVQRTSLDL